LIKQHSEMTASTLRLILTLALLAIGSGVARAQQPPPQQWDADVRIGAIVSVQPGGYDGSGGPYLNNSLGGTVPGLHVAFGFAAASRALFSVELTTTAPLEALQSGRFIVGEVPTRATHRDTLISVLAGLHVPAGRATVEVKGGISGLFGTPRREAHLYDDPGGVVAFTAGIDAVAPIGDRIAIVPSCRYSLANRGADALYFGLGKQLLRCGVSLGIKLTQRKAS
jgi:hypothetical protein